MLKLVTIVVDDNSSDSELLAQLKRAMGRVDGAEFEARYKHWLRGGLVSQQERCEYSRLKASAR